MVKRGVWFKFALLICSVLCFCFVSKITSIDTINSGLDETNVKQLALAEEGGESHSHNFAFSASGNVLTETCTAEGCEFASVDVPVVVSNTKYNQTLSVSMDFSRFNSEEGKALTLESFELKYFSTNEENKTTNGSELSSVPTDIGYYYVQLTGKSGTIVDGKTLVCAFNITNNITLSVSDWVYGNTPNKPIATATVGTIKYYYKGSTDAKKVEFDIDNFDNYPTRAGSYTLFAVVEDTQYPKNNATAKISFNILKRGVIAPEEDKRSFTFNGFMQTYNISGGEHYTISGNKQKNAGSYKVRVTLNDATNYVWLVDGVRNDSATLEYEFVIAKKSVEIPAADNRKFVYSGSAKTYNIATSSEYVVSNNTTQTEPGIYLVTVSLSDTTNFEWSDGTCGDLQYEFKINRSSIAAKASTDKNSKSTKLVSIVEFGDEGLLADVNFIAKSYTKQKSSEIKNAKTLLSSKLSKLDKIFELYQLGFEKTGEAYSYDGSMSIKLQVPEKLKNVNFRLYHIYDGENGERVCEQIEDFGYNENGFVTLQVSELGEFAFVYEQDSLKVLIIISSVIDMILLALLGVQLYLFLKNKKNKKTVLAAAVPMFFVGGELAASIVLVGLMVLLVAANIVFFVLNRKSKRGENGSAEPCNKKSKITTKKSKNTKV